MTNANIVFAPSICLPNQMYCSLPMLAGALRRAGHHPRMVDLNLLAADLLLTNERTDRYLDMARRQATALTAARDPGAARFTQGIDALAEKLRRGPAAKSLLRDPERYFDAGAFRDAFWTVVDDLGFFYQLDPVVSPHRASFLADLIDYQRRDPWTVMTDLYQEGLLDATIAGDPALIGISVAFPEQAAESLRLARRIRERLPDVHISLGGPLIGGHADKWLADGWIFDLVDSVCIGDGETTIVELCDALARNGDLRGVRNLVHRDAAGHVHRPASLHLERMDDLPLPDFDSFPMERYFTPRPIYPLMTSRGCYWGRCTFCSIGWRENFRAATEARIDAEIRHLIDRYQARYVQVNDSSLPPRAAAALARSVAAIDHELFWVAGMKFDRTLLDRSFCERLREGGCRSLMLGFESATQRLVDLMDKGFQVEQVPTMLDNLRHAGISAELLWFIGFPGEERTEALDTVRFLLRHKQRFGLSAFVSEYQLHPDTMVFDEPRRFGVTITGQHNGVCDYRVDSGMQIDELAVMKNALESTNNRTLICNGSHLLHLAERGMDLSGLERPLTLPAPLVDWAEQPAASATSSDRAPDDGPVFAQDFGFRSALEDQAEMVIDEWQRLPREEFLPWPQPGAYAGSWTVFGFYIAGQRLERNLAMCPGIAALIERIPGLYTAGFSCLGPHTTLPLHRGERDDMLRCHLGIVVPPHCAIRISGHEYRWQAGRTFVFDDTAEHDAWNLSDDTKVLLLIDFARPDWLPTLASDRRDATFYRNLFPEWS